LPKDFDNKCCSVGDIKTGINALKMRANRWQRHNELLGYLLIAFSTKEEVKDFGLPSGK